MEESFFLSAILKSKGGGGERDSTGSFLILSALWVVDETIVAAVRVASTSRTGNVFQQNSTKLSGQCVCCSFVSLPHDVMAVFVSGLLRS